MKATSVIWRPCVRRDNNDDKSGSTTGRSKTDDRPVRVGSWYITPESLHHRRTDRHNKQKLSHAPVLFLLKKYNRASVLVCRFGRLYYCSTAVTPTWPNSFKLSIFSHSDNKRHGDDRRPVLVVFCRMRGHASAWYNWLFLVVYQLLVFPFFFVRCLWLSRFYQNRAPPCNRLTSGSSVRQSSSFITLIVLSKFHTISCLAFFPFCSKASERVDCNDRARYCRYDDGDSCWANIYDPRVKQSS